MNICRARQNVLYNCLICLQLILSASIKIYLGPPLCISSRVTMSDKAAVSDHGTLLRPARKLGGPAADGPHLPIVKVLHINR